MDKDNTTRKVSSFVTKKTNSPRSDSACLLIIQGDSLGRRVILAKELTVIGRVDEADFTLDDPNVSRKHAVIRKHKDLFTIEDNQSTNGTFINTKKVIERELKDQDLVLIGNTVLKFVLSDNLEMAYHEELYKYATRDSFLGIYNRTYCMEKLRDELNNSRRHEKELSIIFFDIDLFKKVNDLYGHQAGDKVLKQVTEITQKCLREVDSFGRYGGEEFIIILPGTDIDHATGVAERVRLSIENNKIYHNSIHIPVTISLGVCSYAFLPDQLKTLEALIEKADEALYRAKKEGRNRTCKFNITEAAIRSRKL